MVQKCLPAYLGGKIIPFPKRSQTGKEIRIAQLLRIRYDRTQPFETRVKAVVEAAMLRGRRA
jgi:hypothetical protein